MMMKGKYIIPFVYLMIDFLIREFYSRGILDRFLTMLFITVAYVIFLLEEKRFDHQHRVT